jgi:hypothetical protein
MIENECGTESLSCDGWTPEQMERIRFGVLKLVHENKLKLNAALNLAQTDWRDLLISAGFDRDVDAHKAWAKNVGN